MRLTHDNVHYWYSISNLTLPTDRGDQELSNGVNDHTVVLSLSPTCPGGLR